MRGRDEYASNDIRAAIRLERTGQEVTLDGEQCLIMREPDVLAVMDRLGGGRDRPGEGRA